MGIHTSEIVQDKYQGDGIGAGTTSRLYILQPDDLTPYFLPVGKSSGGRGYNLGHDSYIIGQLSGPIGQVISFSQSLQDAKISLERLNEINNKEEEIVSVNDKINVLPENWDITMENVCFSYDGAERDYVLDNLNLIIPHNKVTAIVGASGSGKTTVVKLLLGFYGPVKGDIKVGNYSLKDINPHLWRQNTGAVMQEGFLFSDSIAKNIAISDESVDTSKLLNAVEMANIKEFIESLPQKYNSKQGEKRPNSEYTF